MRLEDDPQASVYQRPADHTRAAKDTFVAFVELKTDRLDDDAGRDVLAFAQPEARRTALHRYAYKGLQYARKVRNKV